MEEAPLQHWYALKLFYNKVFEMESLLQQRGMETYLAVQSVRLKGRRTWLHGSGWPMYRLPKTIAMLWRAQRSMRGSRW